MRRRLDFYPTPEFATEILLRHVPLSGRIFECCVGAGDIAQIVKRRGDVMTNDIDPSRPANYHEDAAQRHIWRDVVCDWTVTNPPFSHAPKIVPFAYEHSREGIAMLLRLSFLEPTEDRGWFLNEHPPTTLIVLPRISFTGNGKTDNVTCAWMVWDKSERGQRIIVAENPRFVKSTQMEIAA